jgi:hypothetical protein
MRQVTVTLVSLSSSRSANENELRIGPVVNGLKAAGGEAGN